MLRPAWQRDGKVLGQLAGADTSDYAGFLEALRLRRQAFIAAGGLATDHGHLTADATPLPESEAGANCRRPWTGEATAVEGAAFEPGDRADLEREQHHRDPHGF